MGTRGQSPRRFALRECLWLTLVLLLLGFLLASLLVRFHSPKGAAPLLDFIQINEGLAGWILVGLAAMMGMTFNQLWGVAYHSSVKHDYDPHGWPMRLVSIWHAGFITILLLGLGDWALPGLVTDATDFNKGASLALAGALGYFNKLAFRRLYDGLAKILGNRPDIEVDEKLVQGVDHLLAELTAPSLALWKAFEPDVKKQQAAKTRLVGIVKRLERRGVRYSHELIKAVATEADAKRLDEEEAPLLLALAHYCRLASAVTNLPIAKTYYAKGIRNPQRAFQALQADAMNEASHNVVAGSPSTPYLNAFERAAIVRGEAEPGESVVEISAPGTTGHALK